MKSMCEATTRELPGAAVIELAAFTGPDAEQEDDITLVCLQRSRHAGYAGGGE